MIHWFIGSPTHIKQWCDEVSKRRLNAGGCLWGTIFERRSQGFAYWVNLTQLRSRLLQFNTLKTDDIMKWYTYVLVDHEAVCHTGERLKGFEPKGWVDWQKSVCTYLDNDIIQGTSI